MKNLILGMMLIMGSLSFASQDDRGNGNHFNLQNTQTEVSQNVVINDDVIFGLNSNNRD